MYKRQTHNIILHTIQNIDYLRLSSVSLKRDYHIVSTLDIPKKKKEWLHLITYYI